MRASMQGIRGGSAGAMPAIRAAASAGLAAHLYPQRHRLQLRFECIELCDCMTVADQRLGHDFDRVLLGVEGAGEGGGGEGSVAGEAGAGAERMGAHGRGRRGRKRDAGASEWFGPHASMRVPPTICPSLAIFLISAMTFFSWFCSAMRSRSSSRIDLSSMRLFSRRISAKQSKQHLHPHAQGGAGCMELNSSGHLAGAIPPAGVLRLPNSQSILGLLL